MCLTTRVSVPGSAHQSCEAGAAAQLGHSWNIHAPEFYPSQQSSEAGAAAQRGHTWNIDAPVFIPAQQSSEERAAAKLGIRWNVNAPEFVPRSQTAISVISQVRLHTMGSACVQCSPLRMHFQRSAFLLTLRHTVETHLA